MPTSPLFWITEAWPFILSLVSLMIWLVRLEGKSAQNHELIQDTMKDVEALRIKHETLDSKLVQELARIRESLARLETTFKVLGIGEKDTRGVFDKEK